MPDPCPPKVMLSALAELAAPPPAIDRLSTEFLGVIRFGQCRNRPRFNNKTCRGYPLEDAAHSASADRRARLNDADVQGSGIVLAMGSRSC
jgi:hypothetical protein